MIPRIIRFCLKAEALQVTFIVGTIFGMVAEAVLITVPRMILSTATIATALAHHVL